MIAGFLGARRIGAGEGARWRACHDMLPLGDSWFNPGAGRGGILDRLEPDVFPRGERGAALCMLLLGQRNSLDCLYRAKLASPVSSNRAMSG